MIYLVMWQGVNKIWRDNWLPIAAATTVDNAVKLADEYAERNSAITTVQWSHSYATTGVIYEGVYDSQPLASVTRCRFQIRSMLMDTLEWR